MGVIVHMCSSLESTCEHQGTQKYLSQDSLRIIYYRAKQSGDIDRRNTVKTIKVVKESYLFVLKEPLRTFNKLRKKKHPCLHLNFSKRKHHIDSKSICQVLHRHGYKYLQSRKKDLLSLEEK